MSPLSNRGLAITVALLAALGSASPAIAQEPDVGSAQPADPQPISTRVELVADTLPDDTRAEVAAEVDTQLAAMAGDHNLVVAESESAELLLRVEFGQPDHKNPVYVVHSVVLYNGEVLERGDAQTCLRCTPAELVAEGLAILPSAAAQAFAARPEPVDEQVPSPTVVGTSDPGIQQDRRTPPPGPAAYTGIALGALGLISAITGGVFLDRGEVTTPNDNALYLTVTKYRPPGIVLLSVGLTSMITGTVLLAVDAWVLAPRRATKTSRIELSGVGLRF